MADSILKKGHFALIQGNTHKGNAPSLNLVNNNDGTFTVEVSYKVTFKPDVPVNDSQDIDLKNSAGIDYASFPKTGGEIANQTETFCQFKANADGIVFVTTSINTAAFKINHGEKINHGN